MLTHLVQSPDQCDDQNVERSTMTSRAPAEVSRVARQHAWREVNENIASLADRLTRAIAEADRDWTFMCECGGAPCREMLPVPLGAYRAARLGDCFIVATGHEAPSDRVVERQADYVVVALA